MDIEIYTPTAAGSTSGGSTTSPITAGVTREFTVTWTVPQDQPLDVHTVKVGIFGTGWSWLQHWNNSAAVFLVVDGGPPPAPTTTRAPAPTPAPPAPTDHPPRASPTTPPSGGSSFVETFDGRPGTPEVWDAQTWDVFQHSRDRQDLVGARGDGRSPRRPGLRGLSRRPPHHDVARDRLQVQRPRDDQHQRRGLRAHLPDAAGDDGLLGGLLDPAVRPHHAGDVGPGLGRRLGDALRRRPQLPARRLDPRWAGRGRGGPSRSSSTTTSGACRSSTTTTSGPRGACATRPDSPERRDPHPDDPDAVAHLDDVRVRRRQHHDGAVRRPRLGPGRRAARPPQLQPHQGQPGTGVPLGRVPSQHLALGQRQDRSGRAPLSAPGGAEAGSRRRHHHAGRAGARRRRAQGGRGAGSR